MAPNQSTQIVKRFQLIFLVSSILLIFSIFGAYYSLQRLIYHSSWVNHTNEVLLEAKDLSALVKDAETGQRGYMITLDPNYLESYTGAYQKVMLSADRLKELTKDNPDQQKQIIELKSLITDRFKQMENVLTLAELDINSSRKNAELQKGKYLMDQLEGVLSRIGKEESRLLKVREESQVTLITWSPIAVITAGLISVLITALAFIRIKKDLDERVKKQEEEQRQYRITNERIGRTEVLTTKVAEGNYDIRSEDIVNDDLGRIGKALNNMISSLKENDIEASKRNWLQAGLIQLGKLITAEKNVQPLCENLLVSVSEYVSADLATIYLLQYDHLKLMASYGAANPPDVLRANEGMLGKCLEKGEISLLDEIPATYLKIGSSLGSTEPVSVLMVPLRFGDEKIGVMEFAFLRPIPENDLNFFEQGAEMISTGLNTAIAYERVQELLEETQSQAEELQAQHSELENVNAELEAQAEKLQSSEEELRVQQQELQQTNIDLEERTLLLSESNMEINRKAEELTQATKYKSEFLANMSHELRTPLNSILLLSRLLSDNPDHNLNKEQIEYADVIRNSGNGLLSLIDEILDLSKIEAGKMELHFEDIAINKITEELRSLFAPVCKEKGIQLNIIVDQDIPSQFKTDEQRLQQILKNLLSNAVKFTPEGGVTLKISHPSKDTGTLCFEVIDTGIGIAEDKQHLIFDAFQQEDGSTKRKFGGTGLGLSICKELSRLLGGHISITSTPGEGSNFTLWVPVDATVSNIIPAHTQLISPVANNEFISENIPEAIPDSRNDLKPDDHVILIVEDDTQFAKVLQNYTLKQGYKAIVSVRGDEVLDLARKYVPKGILLDLQLPVKSGWQILEELKSDPTLRHIPVHIMSSHQAKKESLMKGAVDFIDKPVAIEQMKGMFQKIEYVLSRQPKKVLILEDNQKHAKALGYFLDSFKINSEVKTDVKEGIRSLKTDKVNCVILDMGIPDRSTYEVLEEVKKDPALENLPVIVFTGKSLSKPEEQKIRKYADSIVIKTAQSYQRMLDEVSIFLHLIGTSEPSGSVQYSKSTPLNEVLNNKTVLVADDDVRNIFSLSKTLETLKMKVITANDGKEAIDQLAKHPEIDIILLDMMMPNMDGYETARLIRKSKKTANVPIIAVTAKAMMGDRQKCISAGASDYITKPVDIDQLLSLLRVWLYDKN